jgi:beta-glucosidase
MNDVERLADAAGPGFGVSRRRVLATAAGLAMAPLAQAHAATGQVFPADFLWGAATSGYQVEGGNINADNWILENVRPTIYGARSGDACDHYHRYKDDIRLLKRLGLNTFRFSIEWSRIEPEEGFYSNAEIDHYRDVLDTCHEAGVTPMVTLNHYTTPRWFAGLGGWENDRSPARFLRYSETVTKALGPSMGIVSTFNEPNLRKMLRLNRHRTNALTPVEAGMLAQARAKTGAPLFVTEAFADVDVMEKNMLEAHRLATDRIKSLRPRISVGVNLAMTAEEAVGSDDALRRRRDYIYAAWMHAVRQSDFIGVQTYTHARIGPEGKLPPEPGTPLTQLGYEYSPGALEPTIRYAAQQTNKPVYVTENGVGVADDALRIRYIRGAVSGVANCLRDGIDVRSYVHWALLDNFEWESGYEATFGLVAVDRTTFRRTVKDSGRFLGALARSRGSSALYQAP